MKAIIEGTAAADAPESDLVTIEGKGVAQYHDISAAGSTHHDAAWSYPDPYPASFDRVGKDYAGYVAFDKRQVTITE